MYFSGMPVDVVRLLQASGESHAEKPRLWKARIGRLATAGEVAGISVIVADRGSQTADPEYEHGGSRDP